MIGAATGQPAPPSPPAAAPLPTDAVVARRGGIELTVGEVDAKIRSMPPDLRSGYLLESDRMARLVDSMLLVEQIAAEATRSGLDRTDEFEQDLALLRAELLSRKHVEKRIEDTTMPDFDRIARERYLADPETYATAAQVDLRHVLVTTDGRDEETALARAEEVLAKARAGEDFIALVQEYSDESSKATAAGLIKNADGTRLDPKFAAAMAPLEKVGDLVGPVRSRFGYHVIRLERFQPAVTLPFEDVRGDIVRQLRATFLENERSRYMVSFSGKDVELNNEVIRALPLRYAPGLTSRGGSDSAATEPAPPAEAAVDPAN